MVWNAQLGDWPNGKIRWCTESIRKLQLWQAISHVFFAYNFSSKQGKVLRSRLHITQVHDVRRGSIIPVGVKSSCDLCSSPSHSSIVSLFASFFCWFVKVFMNLHNSFACPLVAGNLYIGSPIGSWSFVNEQKQWTRKKTVVQFVQGVRNRLKIWWHYIEPLE